MNSAYAEWIAAFVVRHNHFVRGKCERATREMVEAFPELRRAAGFAHAYWGRDQHWWCVTPDGSIVDPTASQFGQFMPDYEELDLGNPGTRALVPTGRCPDCGGEVFGGETFCGPECERATATYLSGGGEP